MVAVPTDGDAYYESKKESIYKIVSGKFNEFQKGGKIDVFSLLNCVDQLINSDMPHQMNCLRYRLDSYYISFSCWNDDHRISTTDLAKLFNMEGHPAWNSAMNLK